MTFLDENCLFMTRSTSSLIPKTKKRLDAKKTKLAAKTVNSPVSAGLRACASVYLLVLLCACLCFGMLLCTQPAKDLDSASKKQPKTQRTKTAQKTVNSNFTKKKSAMRMKCPRVKEFKFRIFEQSKFRF